MRTMANVALMLLLAFAVCGAYRLELRLISDAENASTLQGKNDKAFVASPYLFVHEKDIELRPENFAAVVTRAQELAGLP